MKKTRMLIGGRRCGKTAALKKMHEEFQGKGFEYSGSVYRYRCNLEKHLKTKHPKNRHLNLICKLIRYELRGEGLWDTARSLE